MNLAAAGHDNVINVLADDMREDFSEGRPCNSPVRFPVAAFTVSCFALRGR